MNNQNNITKKSKRYGEKIWIKLEFNIIALTLISTAFLISDLHFFMVCRQNPHVLQRVKTVWLYILLDFNLISLIFYFLKRFSMQSMFWLVKSYNFTSQNAILTSLHPINHHAPLGNTQKGNARSRACIRNICCSFPSFSFLQVKAVSSLAASWVFQWTRILPIGFSFPYICKQLLIIF